MFSVPVKEHCGRKRESAKQIAGSDVKWHKGETGRLHVGAI